MSITIERDPERLGGYRIADAMSGDVQYIPIPLADERHVIDAQTFAVAGAICTADLMAEMRRPIPS